MDMQDYVNEIRALHASGQTPDHSFRPEKPRFEAGKVWINPTQHFDNVLAAAWTFHIGGYPPAQKWLNDRKARQLSWDDSRHYQKIIKILAETDRIMAGIELPME